MFLTEHYPAAAGDEEEAVYRLFKGPDPESIHLVEASDYLGEYDTANAESWLQGEDASTYPDDVFSYLVKDGKIPAGEYLVIFE
jgi:hypothetical protein